MSQAQPPAAAAGALNFRLFGIPVFVQPPFFFVIILLAMSGRRGVPELLTWVVTVTVAVLVHELGHATVGRMFGLSPRIDLHAMGGTTSWLTRAAVGWAPQAAISLAGPAAGFVLGYATYRASAALATPEAPRLVHLAVHDLLWVTIGWGAFNLLPIWPLDGATALSALATRLAGPRGHSLTMAASAATATVVAAVAAMQGWWWMAALCAYFGYHSFAWFRRRRSAAPRTAEPADGASSRPRGGP